MIFRLLKNDRGVALILVLGSLLVLTTLIVELAFNSRTSQDMAASSRDRLQAYYLARSAFNLVRLQIFTEKQLRSQFASVMKNMKGSGISSEPLCSQLPMSTGLLKGLASGALLGSLQGSENGEGKTEETGEKTAPENKETEDLDLSDASESFLSFEGDFEGQCLVEENKINLNAFRVSLEQFLKQSESREPIPEDDTQKKLLFSLLSQDTFEADFHGKPDKIRNMVNALADWVDRNDRVDEAPGVTGGDENAEFKKTVEYKVKNAKFSSIGEIMLVPGMTDDLYEKLKKEVTIYGEDKINFCQASDTLIKAFVSEIAAAQGVAFAINPKDEDTWAKVLKAVKATCQQAMPSVQEVTATLSAVLGFPPGATLTNRITDQNRFYRIESTGLVSQSRVKISGVIDAGDPNAKAWKTLYYQVE